MSGFYYKLVLRNQGYISKELQEKIQKTRLLIAGCGVGSTVAEAAARLGFCNFILTDGDTVEDNVRKQRPSGSYDQLGLIQINCVPYYNGP